MLYNHIPTASHVLHLQAIGVRCLTALTDPATLDIVMQDPYPPYQKHDVLDFLLHDIRHLLKFIEPSLYVEQIGFSKWLQSAVPLEPFAPSDRDSEVKEPIEDVFIDGDPKDMVFNADVAHCASDMNTIVTHLMGFLKAKWIAAYSRWLNRSDTRFSDSERKYFDDVVFTKSISQWFVNNSEIHSMSCDQVLQAASRLCTSEWDKQQDGVVVRKWLWEIGKQQLLVPHPPPAHTFFVAKEIQPYSFGAYLLVFFIK